MASEALKKIADELKSAREEKNISLQQIAAKTKIDIKFLLAIENANFEILPDLYIKAFIKEYAQYIDLDYRSVIRKIDNVKLGKPEQEAVAPAAIQASEENFSENIAEKKFDSTETASPPQLQQEKYAYKNLNINYIYGGIIAVLLLILIYVLFFKGSSPDIIQESSSEQTANQDNPRFELAGQNANQTDKSAQQPSSNFSDSLRLSVETLGRVWVKVLADGKNVTQQLYQPNSKLSFSAAKNFNVTVGNAGAVKMLFNNKPIQNIGKQGEIRNIVLFPDTIRYYTIIPPAKNENKSPKKN